MCDNCKKLEEEIEELKDIIHNRESTIYCPRCGSCGVIGCCETERCELVGCMYGEIHLDEYRSQKELIGALEKLCKEYNIDLEGFYDKFYRKRIS